MMTFEEGYERAQKQRPGVIVVMGPECATERLVQPLGYHERRAMDSLPGFCSWLEYDLGFAVSPWSCIWDGAFSRATGRDPTRDEWAWLQRKTLGNDDASAWISAAKEEMRK